MIEKIKKILLNNYNNHYGGGDRKLLVHKCDECFFMELEGTAPKGYVIYPWDMHEIYLYNLRGKRIKIIRLCEGVESEKFKNELIEYINKEML